MELFWKNRLSRGVKKIGRTKKLIKVGEISGEYDILTVKEKLAWLIGNKTNLHPEMNPLQRELKTRQLKTPKIRIKKKLKKKNNYCQILVGKYVESSYRWINKRLFKKNRDITIIVMDKYAQFKRFYHELWLQVYVYTFMYVDPETTLVEDYFLDTKIFVENYKKMPTPGPVPKHWLGLSYISSEDYKLDQSFDET